MNANEKFVKDFVQKCKDQIRQSPLDAIRAKCLDCCCYQQNEISLCPVVDCPNYYFRSGMNKSGKVIPSGRKFGGDRPDGTR
jgi:hypothetical protein